MKSMLYIVGYVAETRLGDVNLREVLDHLHSLYNW